jgi:hypothetical protein
MVFGFSGWILVIRRRRFRCRTRFVASLVSRILNLLGALVSGFAPFLGSLARRTIGVGVDGVHRRRSRRYRPRLVYATIRHQPSRSCSGLMMRIFVQSIVALTLSLLRALSGPGIRQCSVPALARRKRSRPDPLDGQCLQANSPAINAYSQSLIQLDGDEIAKRPEEVSSSSCAVQRRRWPHLPTHQ